MYKLQHDSNKPKYQDKAKLCCTDTESFIIHIKTKDFNKYTANDVQKWFDISNYFESDKRPLPAGRKKYNYLPF